MSPPRPAAFFDIDGTLTKSDIFRDLVAFRRAVRPSAWFDATMPVRGLSLLALDVVNRAAVNRVTYSWYEGFRRDELARWSGEFQQGPGSRRFFPRMLEVLAAHARRGDRIVFITGAVEEIVAPLPRLLAERLGVPELAQARLEAIRLEDRDGAFTGRLLGEPLAAEAKARRLHEVAAAERLDAKQSFAYGDSIADAPMLEAVGRPCAVRPCLRLRRLARRRGWPVLDVELATT